MEDTYSAGLSDTSTGGSDVPTSSDLQNLHSSGGKFVVIFYFNLLKICGTST